MDLNKDTNISISNAIFIVDEILKLFGTHIIIQIKIGGIISKTDAVDILLITTNVDQILYRNEKYSKQVVGMKLIYIFFKY